MGTIHSVNFAPAATVTAPTVNSEDDSLREGAKLRVRDDGQLGSNSQVLGHAIAQSDDADRPARARLLRGCL